MNLDTKLEILDLDDDVKNTYINAGYENIKELINATFEELAKVGKRSNFKYFRVLLRYIHDNNLEFKFEDEGFINKLLSEEVILRQLDLSTYLINIFEKYKVYTFKDLYNLINKDLYYVYKFARNEIKNEYDYNKCRGLKKYFSIVDNDIFVCEKRYQEEKNLYLILLNEYIYLLTYLKDNDVDINSLKLRDETKDILLSKNIDCLSKIICNFNMEVINRIKFSKDSFKYKYYISYSYEVIEDIIFVLKQKVFEIYNSKEFFNFKTNDLIKNVKIEELNLSLDIVRILKLNGVNKVEDIFNTNKFEIVSVFGLGNKRYKELLIYLSEKFLLFKNNSVNNNDLVFEMLDNYFEFKNNKYSEINKLVLK